MAVTSHRKLSRKALKQPDEFVSTLEWIGDFISANLVSVIVGAIVLILVIVAVFVGSFYVQHRQRIASEQFYRTINALSDKNYKSAQEGFDTIARSYPGHTLGHLARFYLAVTYLAQKQPAAARSALQKYLAKSGGDLWFRQMALTQLGVANEELRDYHGAHSAYVKAARLKGPEQVRAEIGAARTLALTGDRQGAIAAYQQFLRENPFAQQRDEVIEALAQMGAPPQPLVQKISSPAAAGTTRETRDH
jgi:predicted negative regulator of RcsB-dependent stress response